MMFTAPRRTLPFPLRDALALAAESVPGEITVRVPVFPQDSNERVIVLLSLSLKEYVVLASAIDVGSDIAYGENAIQVWETWSRALMTTTLCEAIAQCIASNPATRDALRQIIGEMNPTGENAPFGEPLSPERLEENLAQGTNPTCDLDVLFGQCRAIVQYTNRAIVDTLEVIEVAANSVELADALSAALPVAGVTLDAAGISGVLQLVNYYQNAIAEQYNAQYTLSVENEIACDLFCVCKDDCVISIERVVNVIEQRLQVYLSPPSLNGLVDLIEFLAGVAQDTTVVVDLAFYAAWQMVRLANFLFGLDRVKTLPTLLALAEDEPSNDWQTLCECGGVPGEIEIFVDPVFPHVPFGALVENAPGSYTATAEQWLPVNGGDGYYRVAVKALAGQTASYTWVGAAAPAGAIFSGYWNTGSSVRQTGDTPDGTGGRWAVYHISTLPFQLSISVVEL